MMITKEKPEKTEKTSSLVSNFPTTKSLRIESKASLCEPSA
jgi:hypothetical protein